MIVQLKSDYVVELFAPRTGWSPVLSAAVPGRVGPGRVASDRVGPGRVCRAGSGLAGSCRVRSASIV